MCLEKIESWAHKCLNRPVMSSGIEPVMKNPVSKESRGADGYTVEF